MIFVITGAAGFIGFHVAKHLLETTSSVLVLVDDFNGYYPVTLKQARRQYLENLDSEGRLAWYEQDIADEEGIRSVFAEHSPDIVIHLAAQAGVRYSRTNPGLYLHTNILGFNTVLRQATAYGARLFLYASSSSVYGNDGSGPSREYQEVVRPVSLYAITKYHNELAARLYARTTRTKTIGMRLFSVYGSWGRPDMAYFKWVDALLRGQNTPIIVFGDGTTRRDMTYVSDVVEAIDRLITYGLACDAPDLIFNIGNSQPVTLLDILATLEEVTSQTPIISYQPKDSSEVGTTWADCSLLHSKTGFSPNTSIEAGLRQFVDWYRSHIVGEHNLQL